MSMEINAYMNGSLILWQSRKTTNVGSILGLWVSKARMFGQIYFDRYKIHPMLGLIYSQKAGYYLHNDHVFSE